MKFNAEPKDVIVFLAFSLGLLYITALMVLNVSSLAQMGFAHGFNPFPAFTAEHVYPTLTFFIIFSIVIVMGVKTYFFDRESGFGFTKKKDKGFARWAKKKEMYEKTKSVELNAKKFEAGGVPLVNDGKVAHVDDGEFHTLVLGATGSGKTQMFIMPTTKILAKAGESLVITDPKGEIYKETGNLLKAYGYNVIILNFRNPQEGNAWNPLALPYHYYKAGNSDKATELLNDLAINILYEADNKSGDPFWEKTAADYFSGLILGLFDDAKEEEVNLNSVNLMSTVGEDRFGSSTYIKEYFNTKDPSSSAFASAASTIMAPNDTKNSIVSVFKQKIKIFTSKEQISEMMSYSDFDMSNIGKEKTAVFLIIQDEKTTYHPLATTFIKQCYESLIDVAQQNNGMLPIRTNFLIDEFANMPPITDITTMITAARSRHIRFNLMIQNFAQLDDVYGENQAETIRGNCGNLIYLITGELKALEEISKLCGEIKIKQKGSDVKETRPLVSISELQVMPRWHVIIKRQGTMPFKTKLTPDYQTEWNIKKYKEKEFPVREKRQIQMFDIKEYVKNKKREKLIGAFDEQKPGQELPGSPFGMIEDSKANTEKPTEGKENFDVDDLVKRIDAKIAALEEEERLEKLKAPKEEPVKETKPEIITNINKDSNQTNQDITDDQFFDDFFE